MIPHTKLLKLLRRFQQRSLKGLTLLVAAVGMLAAPSWAQLKIVTTTPDLADVTRRIGGDLVEVESLAVGTQDLHNVPMRPSFVTKLARADGVVHIGLWAEHAFLPALIDAAANRHLQPGARGDIDASRHVTPLEVPETLSRDQGELHPDGNPHYNIDPRKAPLISRAVAEGLARLDPGNAAVFEKNREAFDRDVAAKLTEWEQMAQPLKGIKVVSYHNDMVYLAEFLGIEVIGEIEPKPGIAPSPRHLKQLADLMKKEGVSVIVHEVQYPDRASRWLAKQTGAKIARKGTIGGAFPGTDTYIGMIDRNIRNLLEALP